MISGPFFIGRLVGVGCRLVHLGPGLGTLAPTPMCAYQAHIVISDVDREPAPQVRNRAAQRDLNQFFRGLLTEIRLSDPPFLPNSFALFPFCDRATCGRAAARLGVARSTVESEDPWPSGSTRMAFAPPGAEVTSLPPSGLISKTRSLRLGIRAVVLGR